MSWDTHSETGSCPWRSAGQDVFSNTPVRQDKRRQAVSFRTEKLGKIPTNPASQLLREQLQSGFYLSYTGRKSFRILHRSGSCYNLPGLDYPIYKYMGTVLPSVSEYAP